MGILSAARHGETHLYISVPRKLRRETRLETETERAWVQGQLELQRKMSSKIRWGRGRRLAQSIKVLISQNTKATT